jgi:hypothetical protein
MFSELCQFKPGVVFIYRFDIVDDRKRGSWNVEFHTDFEENPPFLLYLLLLNTKTCMHTPTQKKRMSQTWLSYENGKQFKAQAHNKTKRMINVVDACYRSLSLLWVGNLVL